MERTSVRSKSIAIIGYDRAEECLEVAFRTGSVYHYKTVPAQVFQGLQEAESTGRFFEEEVRNKYPYELVTPSQV